MPIWFMYNYRDNKYYIKFKTLECEIMSPTIFRKNGIRYFFFSREETRRHVHILSADGEAKFWMEPKIEK